MKKIAVIGVVLVVLALVLIMMMSSLVWDGGANVEVRFHICESASSGPVRGARVHVIRDSQLDLLSNTNFSAKFPPVITDGRGQATLQVMCPAGGGHGLFGKTGRFRFAHDLSVEAQGYRTLSTPLANVVGGVRWPLSKRVFDVESVLFKNP
jgi:hypothetical protein